MGSIAKRADGRWAGRLHIGYENGRRLTKWVYSRVSAADCEQKLADERQRLRLGMSPSDERWTVNDMAASWLANQSVAISPTSFERWETTIRLHIAPVIGTRVLTKLSPVDVIRVRSRAIEAKLAPRTVGQVVGLVSMILRAAVREGRVGRNVAEGIRVPEVPERPVLDVSMADLSRLVAAFGTHRFGAVYGLALGAGLRRGEILALRRDDIDLQAGTVRVDEGLQRGRVCGPPKTRTSLRTVAVSPFALALLERHLATHPAHISGFLFTSRTGETFDGNVIPREFHALLAKLGLARIRFHDLRGLHATWLRALDVDHAVIAAQLGHGKRDTTDRYARVMPSLQREAVLRFDRAVKEAAA